MRRPLSTLALALHLVGVGACDRAPAEPPPTAAPARRPPLPLPSLSLAAARITAVLDASVADLRPLDTPAPAGALVVGFTQQGNPSAALVDAARAWVGRDGAERALALWAQVGEAPDAPRLARVVTDLVYPGCTVATGAGGPAPSLTNHPGGGRWLVFSFVIPAGRVGAGLHVARWRWTDPGLLIEETPRP